MKADIEARHRDGATPVFIAARQGQAGVVEILLKYGANTKVTDNSGNTLLHAAVNGGVILLQKILTLGIDVNVQNSYGFTPLHWAAEYGKIDVIQLLLKCGANPRLKNIHGQSPSQVALVKGNNEAYKLLQAIGR